MLRFLSQRTGFTKVILWIFIGILILGLGIVFAIPASFPVLGNFAPIGSSTVVASVDGYPITLSELQNKVRTFGQNAQSAAQGQQQEPAVEYLYPAYGKQAIDTLINARLVRREADRFGLGATKQEMQDRITSIFVGPDGKWIGTSAYQVRLRQQGLTVEQFERDVADSIVEEKLRNFLTSAVMVSDREIEEDYKRANTTMTPTYVLVSAKPDAVPPASDEELRAYFAQNTEKFKITQPQRKVAYLFVSQEAVGRTIEISDDELKTDFNPKDYVSAVHAAQIVLRVADPAKDADIRKRAEEIAEQARAEGADFAKIAGETSEDAATKANGGDIGWLEKASMPPSDPRMRIFQVDVNQTTAPIKVGDTYTIFKVLERREKSFEEARPDLLTAARSRKAYGRGIEVAQQAKAKLAETKDPQRAANDMNASLGAPADAPVVTVRETPYVQPGEAIPDVGANPQFQDEVAKLENKGDVGEVVGISNGFAVPMLADKRDPHDASFEEVRDRVAATYRDDRARQIAREQAQQLATATGQTDLIERAKAAGLAPKSQPNWKAGMALPERGPSDLVDSALLSLPANTVASQPLEAPDGFLVLAQGERKEPDMGAPFEQQRDSTRERLLATKRNEVFSAYMLNIRKKLEESGDIVIYQSTLDRAFDVESDDDLDDEEVPTTPPVGSPSPSAILPVKLW